MKPISLEPANRMSWLWQIGLYSVSDGVPRRFFLVAMIVGTILNLINQGDALFGEGHVNPMKIMLTFAIPYCVATYGAVSYRLSRTPSSGGPASC